MDDVTNEELDPEMLRLGACMRAVEAEFPEKRVVVLVCSGAPERDDFAYANSKEITDAKLAAVLNHVVSHLDGSCDHGQR